jgi:pyridoxamine 5'-phosphate oxidase-like protein
LAADRKVREGLTVTSWSAFASDAPELARTVQDVLKRHGFMFAGTIRRDGSPRISPVEVHISDGRLFVVVIPRTAKAHDLDRDPRIVLQSPIASAGSPGLEVKLRARAGDVLDRDLQAAMAASVEEASGWRPGEQWRYCELLLTSVAVLDWVDGDMLLHRWSAAHGLRMSERRHLEHERGEYARTY